jgi:predicted transcriptional regulator
MSTTTTVRLPETLRTRVAQLAKRAGKTPHAFILDAIAEKADQEERHSAFHDIALERFQNLAEAGGVLAWDEMHAYLEARASGKAAKRPVPKKLAR